MKNNGPMVLLVDSHHGIYTHKVLAETYPLFMAENGDHIPLLEWMNSRADFDGETLESVFDPDNEDWCENIEYIEYHNQLRVKNGNGTFWEVQSIDGDIFAINPLAEWDDEMEGYYIPAVQSNLHSYAQED